MPRAELLSLIKSAALVAVPSVWAENQPIIVLEAMACGVPVVSGASPPLRELVQPDVSGIAVDPHDHAALANAISTYTSNPALQGVIGGRARSFVEEHHDMETHLDALEKVYRGEDLPTEE